MTPAERVEKAQLAEGLARLAASRARTELRAALDALAVAEAEALAAKHALMFAEYQRTGDPSALPRCQWFGIEQEGDHSGSCDEIATRHGACEPANSYCCDEHKCRHACPELPWAAMVRSGLT